MRLEYKILWIDNDLEEYIENNSVQDVEDFLTDNGFEPLIEKVFDEKDINKYLNKEYDLIISDFNLNKENGDVIIYRLREEKKLDTEILFYSAKSNFINDQNVKDRLAFMERINIQIGRDNLIEKIEKVIKLTLNKLLEINATRGLITAATSDLDVEIEDVVLNIVTKQGKTNDELKSVITKKSYEPLKNRVEKFWEKYESFNSHFHKMDAVKKWEIFRDLLKPLNTQPEIKSFLAKNKSYQKEVINIRNQFAHAKSIEEDGVLKLKGQVEGQDFEFTEESCIKIRKDLIIHKKNIEKLKQFLSKG